MNATYHLYIVMIMHTNREGETIIMTDFIYDNLMNALEKQKQIVIDFESFNENRGMIIKQNDPELFYACSNSTVETAHVRILHREIISH